MLWSRIAVIVTISLSVLLGACQLRPLHATNDKEGAGLVIGDEIRDHLAAIVIAKPSNKNEQILRNRLLYLLGSEVGQGRSVTSYQLELRVNVSVVSAVRIDIGDRTDRTGRASAGTVRAAANYRLLDDKGSQMAQKQRSISASFDRPRQEYANLQAEDDAKRRALEELAEQIYLSIVQDMVKRI